MYDYRVVWGKVKPAHYHTGTVRQFFSCEWVCVYTCVQIPFNKGLNFIKTRGMVPLSAPGEPRRAAVADGIKEQRESWD